MQRDDLLVWADLEMTSIEDVRKDTITAIATIVTDSNLQIVAEGPELIIRADPRRFDELKTSDPFVYEMHQKSGMLAANDTTALTMQQAEEQTIAFFSQYVLPGSSPLCGNSIHQDRHFIRYHMPKLDTFLHYRQIDVSTLKELARRWRPEVYEEVQVLKKNKMHRAKADIIGSLEELKIYRREFLKL